ncbi:MAG: 3-keto-disaccharide hydrolase [Armatimonadota bacterium]
MKTFQKLISVVLVVLLAATTRQTIAAFVSKRNSTTAPPDNTLTPEEKAAAWKLLFDGKTLKGWRCTEKNSRGWVVDNGTIHYNKQGHGYLYTEERFGDFELKIDFMVDRGTNSGIFFRWDDLSNPVQTGIEMQILDSAGKKRPGKHDCGAIYDVLEPSENAMKPALEWNTALIRCHGPYITITLNGKRIIAMNLDKYTEPHKNLDGTRNKFATAYKDMPREGHIGLQPHGGKIWYKNIKIRRL